jgi:hypothetical protein
VQDWLKELSKDGGPDSVQQAFWNRLNDFVDRYDEHVSTHTDSIRHSSNSFDTVSKLAVRVTFVTECHGTEFRLLPQKQ